MLFKIKYILLPFFLTSYCVCLQVAKEPSQPMQCCFCTCSVLSTCIGMFMLSTGVCLLLNYNFFTEETDALASNKHHDESRKTLSFVFIFLGCFVFVSGIAISIFFFTTTSHKNHTSLIKQKLSKSEEKAVDPLQVANTAGRMESTKDNQDFRLNPRKGLTISMPVQPSSSPRNTQRTSSSVPIVKRCQDSRGSPSYSRKIHTPPSSSRHNNQRLIKSKRISHGRFTNRLAPHPEEEAQAMTEPRRPGSSLSKQRSLPSGRGLDNFGYCAHDDENMSSILSEQWLRSSTVSSVFQAVPLFTDNRDINNTESTDIHNQTVVAVSSKTSDYQSQEFDDRNSFHDSSTDRFSYDDNLVTISSSCAQLSSVQAYRAKADDGFDDEEGRRSRDTLNTLDSSDRTLTPLDEIDTTSKLDRQLSNLVL